MSDRPVFPSETTELVAWLDKQGRDSLPGLLGIEIVELVRSRCVMRLQIEQKHFASNGYLHAASVVALADTATGYGTVASLPDGATGFTTIELKSNHIGTASKGWLVAHANLAHGGRTTQVWDATVSAEHTGKTVALFRNTQLILYP
jgi:1,4-dihydroxy-2-naphthoyl-CoA hydrolase